MRIPGGDHTRGTWPAIALGAIGIVSMEAPAGPVLWTNAAGGSWGGPTNWSSLSVPLTPAETAEIGVPGVYAVSLGLQPDLAGLIVSNPNAMLGLLDGSALVVRGGGIANEGMIRVGEHGAAGARIELAVDSTIAGQGRLELAAGASGPGTAELSTGFGVLGVHGASHTIAGSGSISGLWLNEGRIVADTPGGGLLVSGVVLQSTDGVLSALDDAVLAIGNATTVAGGVFQTEGTATVAVTAGEARIAGVHNLGRLGVDVGASLEINGDGLRNDGSIVLRREGPSGPPTTLLLTEGGAIGGVGTIVLNESGFGSEISAVLTTSGPLAASIGPGQTVTGYGRFNGSWIVDGVVLADRDREPIWVQGQLDLSGGGVLRSQGSGFIHLDSAEIIGGVLDGAPDGDPEGGVFIDHSFPTVLRGTVNIGRLCLSYDAEIDYHGDRFTNDGTVEIGLDDSPGNGGRITFFDSVVLDGTGRIIMDNGGTLAVTQGETATIAPGTEVIGGDASTEGDWINEGLVTVVEPDEPGLLRGFAFTGLLEQRGAGRINVENGGEFGIYDRIVGGTIDMAQFAAAEMLTPGILDGVTINGGQVGVFRRANPRIAAGGVVNNSLIVVNNTAEPDFTSLLVEADAEISGQGRIRLNGRGDQALFRALPGVTATLGPGQVVEGYGVIEGDWIVEGTIASTVPGERLSVTGSVEMGLNAEFRAQAGELVLESVEIGGGRAFVTEGELVFGLGVRADEFTIDGDALIDGRGNLTLTDEGLVNNGVLTLNRPSGLDYSYLIADEDTSVGGVGTIDLLRERRSEIRTNNGSTLTIGAGQTVVGRGMIRNTVVLEGGLAPGPGLDEIVLGDFGEPGVVTLAPSSSTRIELGDDGASDTLEFRAPVTLGGSLELSIADGAAPALPAEYRVVWTEVGPAPALTGSYDDVIFVTDGADGRSVTVTYEPDAVVVTLRCTADFAEPFGVLDLADIVAFVTAFLGQDPSADLAEPFGTFDLSDLLEFAGAFGAGCG